MFKKNLQRSIFNFMYIFVLIYSFLFPHWAFGSISDLRLKTLLNICEAAQSTGDGGTITNIALQLKATQFDTETDLGKQAVKCIEAGFPSDEKSASFEGMIVKINKLQTELRELCFNLLELKPTQAITFAPCKEFY
jgi:hypothetical protein